MPWMVLLGLIIVGFSSRLLIDVPNFKPIAAIALFSGFYFRKLWVAVAATGLTLLISDWQIGSYAWPIALSVYGSLLIGCLLGHYFISQTKQRLSKTTAVRTGVSALTMSVLFFVVTNFAVWATGWYPQTTEGLTACYFYAVPFFKYTLAGDLCFTAAIFGSYALASIALGSKSTDLVSLEA